MTDTYYDRKPVQRRTLALVALLALCMVSLTAVAYAYSTTVSIEDNSVADHYYTIDYVDNTGTPLMVPLTMDPTADEIVITTVIGHGAIDAQTGEYTNKTVTASIDANTFTRVFYVEFNADADVPADKAFTISVTATPDSVLDDFITQTSVTYKVNGSAVASNAIVKNNIVEVTLTMSIASVANINTLGLTAQVPATITDATDLVAPLNAVKAELATHTFDVVVAVEPTATP